MEYTLRKAEPRDVSDILRLVKVGGPHRKQGFRLHVRSIGLNSAAGSELREFTSLQLAQLASTGSVIFSQLA